MRLDQVAGTPRLRGVLLALYHYPGARATAGRSGLAALSPCWGTADEQGRAGKERLGSASGADGSQGCPELQGLLAGILNMAIGSTNRGQRTDPRPDRPATQSDLALSLLSELLSVLLSLSCLAPFSFFPGSAVEE